MLDIMTLKNRVRSYCDRKNMAVTKFERTAGLSNGYFKDNLKRMSDDKIESIHRAYPDLNIDWLITGNGEMLKGEAQYIDYEEVREDRRMVDVALLSENDDIEMDLKGLMAECKASARDIATTIGEEAIFVATYNGKLKPRHILALQKRYGDTLVDKYAKYPKMVKAEVIEAIPITSEAVTSDPNTDIAKYVEENSSELETIDPTKILFDANVSVAERIKRTSMLPTYQPDDVVFIRFIEDKNKIVDGEVYYFNCKNRPTMVRLVKFEGEDKLRLVAKNSQYGDIIIERSDIINVGEVVALFRMTFGDQYSEMEALRRKKDSHLERMMELLERSTEQQGQLISHITKEK